MVYTVLNSDGVYILSKLPEVLTFSLALFLFCLLVFTSRDSAICLYTEWIHVLRRYIRRLVIKHIVATSNSNRRYKTSTVEYFTTFPLPLYTFLDKAIQDACSIVETVFPSYFPPMLRMSQCHRHLLCSCWFHSQIRTMRALWYIDIFLSQITSIV